MELYVIRHGQTDWNLENRIQGHTDTKLNETGRRQAQEIAEKFKNINLDLIISSPLSRALDTAQIINQYKKLPIVLNANLKERCFGDFEGKTDLSAYNCDINTLLDYHLNYSENSIEPIQDLFTRVKNFIEYCKHTYPNKSILISTHGGICQALECILLKLPLETNLQTLSLKNCEYRRYVLEVEKEIEL